MAHDKRPVILIAHSNPVEGANLAKQVEDYFYGTYHVQTVSTISHATEISRSLHDSSGPGLAAALIDERLDNGSGQDFLRNANARVLPDKGRLLLTQQPAANHDDGIQRITLSSDGAATFNEEFQKSLEQKLYQAAPPQRSTVIVTGKREKREVITIMRFLRLNSVLYAPNESDPSPAKAVQVTLPKILNPLDDPTLIGLSKALGLMHIADPVSVDPETYQCDVAVVGGGAAGLSAAVNLVALYGKKPLIIEEFAPGGTAATATNIIDNYLGFPDGIQVADLVTRWKKHADNYNIDWLPCYHVTKVEPATTGDYAFKLTAGENKKDRDQVYSLDGGKQVTVNAKKVLLACGIEVKKQGGIDETKYAGQGVYYSALPGDAALYQMKDKPVAIIGGGDTAGTAAILFANAGIKTIMIIRSKLEKDMLEENQSEVKRLNAFIKLKQGTEVKTFVGKDGYLTQLEIVPTGKAANSPAETIEVAAAYVLIGAKGLDGTGLPPNVKVDPKDGGVQTISSPGQFYNMTDQPGFFVAGDARAGSVRRIAEAVGDGGSAALGIYNHFQIKS